MTLSVLDLSLYAGALLVLFLTPGPVWLAMLARTVSGGFGAAWPLALGVAVGDIVWPLLAILGVSWLVAEFDGFLTVLRWVACAMFLWIGWQVIAAADSRIGRDTRLTRPGVWAGFAAGVLAILGNPKAALFYLGALPGFFDLTHVTPTDIACVLALSVGVPLIGNLTLALFVDRARQWVASPRRLRRMNVAAGSALILVGLILPFL